MRSEAARQLVDVDGVGPTYSDALNELGVASVEDLAGQDAGNLAARLAEAGHPSIGEDRIEGWIDHARQLVEQTSPPSDSDDASAAASDGHGTTQLAGFTVFIDQDTDPQRWQTRVYHDESGEELTLDGVDPGAVLQFMFVDALAADRDSLPDAAFRQQVQRALPVPSDGEETHVADGIEVDIVEVTIQAVQAPPHRHERWLIVTVMFEVSELPPIPEQVDDLAYLCEILVVDYEGGGLQAILSRYGAVTATGPTTYRIEAELPMPPVGSYHIETVVLLFPPTETVACRSGPKLSITA